MKIGLFTDTHYCNIECIGNRRPSLSLKKIEISMDAFKNENVDMVLCLGDLVDCPEGYTGEKTLCDLRKALSLIRSYKIPFYMVPGNHDYIGLKGDDFEREGIKIPPYVVENDELRFIFLDANYRSSMKRYDVVGVEWTDSNLPSEQVEFLKSSLKTEKKCVVLVHENLDPTLHETHIIKNAKEIREIIKNSGSVKMVIQGHFHGGNEIMLDNIPYLTVPAMCEGDKIPFKIIEL